MKKIVILILLFIFSGIISAADPAFHGNMLAALQEKDPRIRAGLIISALENSKNEKCDILAVSIIRDDINSGNVDRTLLNRLFLLLKKYPDSEELTALCAAVADKNQFFPEELSSAMQKILLTIDFSQKSNIEKLRFFTYVHIANRNFIDRGEYKKASEFLNQLCEKYPESPVVLFSATTGHINNCFGFHNTAPGLPGYQELPENDFWKTSLNSIAGKIPGAAVNDLADAQHLVLTANVLKLAQTPELLKKYAKKYPSDEWSGISASIADKFNNPDLFIKLDNFFSDFHNLLTVRDFSTLEQMCRNLKDFPRFYFTLLLKHAKDQHGEVLKMANSMKYKFNDLPKRAFFAILSSAHTQRDRKLVEKMINHTMENSSDPVICNAAGYVAADLGIELKKAEHLIRIAVNAQPYVSAFHDSLAWVLFRQKRFIEAEKEITLSLKSCSAERSAAVIFLHAAAVKQALNKNDEAAKFLAIAKKLYSPDDRECSEYDVELQKNLEQLLK